ncbi:hypothetical protein JOF56_009128 [Kibdelosporangium banguiense]|uniref:Transcriptional regulator n=1 Tax=Kibdelosporangium banguiense TaxID=1365924 RepID=A0ABS4TWG4_9PSEU|nr:hypothetical protein [Kibdelosporangium banguiense]MBP2328743.1 hypothetical protein [Kibdelosporangium banguiense]
MCRRGIAAETAAFFGIQSTDLGAVASAVTFATMAGAVREAGASYGAAGLFRSVDGLRPVLALVQCFVLLSDHYTVDAAVAGLTSLHAKQGMGAVRTERLESGPAVVVETVEQDLLTMGDEVFQTEPRSVTAWIPDPAGTCVVGLGVSSNNTEDWDQIKDLAEGVFNAFEWVVAGG